MSFLKLIIAVLYLLSNLSSGTAPIDPCPIDALRPIASAKQSTLLSEIRSSSAGYQTTDELTFIEVKEGEPGGESALLVRYSPYDSQAVIERKIKMQAESGRWWLQRYWQIKGMPREQVSFDIGGHNVHLYSWQPNPLTQDEISQIESILRLFAVIAGGKALKLCGYILLDELYQVNPRSGELANGRMSRDGTMTIFPTAREKARYRIEAASNLEGTIIHELMHLIASDAQLITEWAEAFGWVRTPPREASNGLLSQWRAIDKTRFVSAYAGNNPEDDISDSMVAAIKAPGELDAEKDWFLLGRFLEGIEPLSKRQEVQIKRLSGDDIALPRLTDIQFIILELQQPKGSSAGLQLPVTSQVTPLRFTSKQQLIDSSA